MLFGGLAFADVDHRGSHQPRGRVAGRHRDAFQPGENPGAVRPLDGDLTGFAGAGGQNIEDMAAKNHQIAASDGRRQEPADQLGSGDAKECRSGEIGADDPPALREGEIADGSEVVEIGVTVSRLLKLEMGAAQLFVLLLKLGPVDIQGVYLALIGGA